MAHTAKLFSLATCFLLAVAVSLCASQHMRPTRCERLCSSCKDEAVLAQAACNCTTVQKLSLQEAPCQGKLEGSPNEKSTIRRKRCTPEELYELRARIEATKRNIERLRQQKSLSSANLNSVYYPRQALAVPSVVHPLLTPLAPEANYLRPPLANFDRIGNSRPWQRGSADRESASSPMAQLQNMGNPSTWQFGSVVGETALRHSFGHLESAGNLRPWQRVSADRGESPRPWRRMAGNGQEAQDINDSISPHRHVERAPVTVLVTTTTNPIEFLQKRRKLLEENLQMLLKKVDKVSAENVSGGFSNLNDESKPRVDSAGNLSKHSRKVDSITSLDKEDDTTGTKPKSSKIEVAALFNKPGDGVISLGHFNKTLSHQKDDLSVTPSPLRLELANETNGSAVSNHLHVFESIADTRTTAITEPAASKDNSTRKRLDVIVDIAVMSNPRGNTDGWVAGQVASVEENEEERRKEAVVSQHTPHTLSPPIVLDSNPGIRTSRRREEEYDEGGGMVSNHKEFVPSVSKVFILKSFKPENANFGIPKAQDLYLHKKGPSVFGT